MKLHQVLAAAATLFAIGTASASEATLLDTSSFVSTKSRADVRAEAMAASDAGLLQRGEVTVFAKDGPSTLSRAQVVAEAREAQRLGLLGRGELTVFATPQQLQQIAAAGQAAIGGPAVARAAN